MKCVNTASGYSLFSSLSFLLLPSDDKILWSDLGLVGQSRSSEEQTLGGVYPCKIFIGTISMTKYGAGKGGSWRAVRPQCRSDPSGRREGGKEGWWRSLRLQCDSKCVWKGHQGVLELKFPSEESPISVPPRNRPALVFLPRSVPGGMQPMGSMASEQVWWKISEHSSWSQSYCLRLEI